MGTCSRSTFICKESRPAGQSHRSKPEDLDISSHGPLDAHWHGGHGDLPPALGQGTPHRPVAPLPQRAGRSEALTDESGESMSRAETGPQEPQAYIRHVHVRAELEADCS